MSARLKKIIWAVLMAEIFFLHLYFLDKLRHTLNWVSWKVSARLNLPSVFYDSGYLLTLAGLLGVGLLILLVHFLQYRKFRLQCIKDLYPVADQSVTDCYREVCEASGLPESCCEKIYYGSRVASPFVLGFRSPILLMPKRMKDDPNLHLVFLHECHHMKSRDTLYKLYMLILGSLLWFQPLAWLIRFLSCRDVEIACDEALVADKTEKERLAYGQYLVDCLRLEHSGEYPYSAFFYNGRRVMESRIHAVLANDRRWDGWAYAGIVLLAALTLSTGGIWLTRYITKLYENQKPMNIYENAVIPPFFTGEALQSMLTLTPVAEDSYYNEFKNSNITAVENYEDLPYLPEGPWQIRLKDSSRYGDAAALLYSRYLYYMEDQEKGSAWNPETNDSPITETVYQRLLAGNREEGVFAVIYKEYVSDYEQLLLYQQGHTQIAWDSSGYYAYYAVALHMRMVKDSVFELVGIAEMKDIVSAYTEKYPASSLGDVPELRLYRSSLRPMYASSSDGILKILPAPGTEGETVPVNMEKVVFPSDPINGSSSSFPEYSIQLDSIKQIFAYASESEDSTPEEFVCYPNVTYFDEAEKTWKTTIVTQKYQSSNLFISFPEDSQTGFLLLTTERVVWQEGSSCFRTTNGGATWREIGSIAKASDNQSHSLTTDFTFINNQVGFMTTHSSETPDIWRTADSGATWEQLILPGVPKELPGYDYYVMAYAPLIEDGVLTLYVGMEEYSKYGGTKARFTSQDEGLTWVYQGMAIRK